MHKRKAIVVGAGIAGLAMARALGLKGYKVTVVDRSEKAVGASVRNFGMVWPIGQPSGELFDAAMKSREVWKEFGQASGVFLEEAGSLHLSYHNDETVVLEELLDIYGIERKLVLLNPEQVAEKSTNVKQAGLQMGLYSPNELVIDPREAMSVFPAYLQETFGVEFIWSELVLSVDEQAIYTAEDEIEADVVMVCSGSDIELLFPEVLRKYPLTKCKLQMMRMEAQMGRIGPALCGGLSLIHYNSFKAADSLSALRSRYATEMEEYLQWGIHVMVCQNGNGELTIGDSHEYGHTHDPFDQEFIKRMILDYLSGFASFSNEKIVETWNGVYAKLTDGEACLFSNPQEGVYLFNGLGGAGMTLSFGLSEVLVNKFL